MKISYKKLWLMLVEKDISRQEFRKTVGLASGTMTKLNKGELVSMDILLRICECLDCNIGDICDAIKK
ncbi:helix-turn-helix domain-containing protein [Pseudobutyrivibrio sp.]|uniref:helix-turn-helix domain-containing protein n=1 Tax=Pseudobutyrivibrio sp. TaxID=2014367 RepID=UPI003864E810